jgi:hypothetical protein
MVYQPLAAETSLDVRISGTSSATVARRPCWLTMSPSARRYDMAVLTVVLLTP